MAAERTRTSSAGNRGFSLLEVLVALAIVGAGLAAVFQLVNQQSSIQAQARLQDLAINEANNIMNDWLDRPGIRPGIFRGDTASGMKWEVRVTDLSTRDRLRNQSQKKGGTSTSRRSARAPDLLAVRVCCTYWFMGRKKQLCLASRRLAVLEHL